MKKAVVLLSGGVDSATTLAIARAEGYETYALSFSYGQRHLRELESATRVADALGAKDHLVLALDLRAIGGSALTADIPVPKGRSAEEIGRGIPVTYVPARNTIFLSHALAWAEVLGASEIFFGANVYDYSGYPDCRPEYIRAFERMATLATKAGVEGTSRFKIHTPLIRMTKAEIVRRGHALGLDFALTWSCYEPAPEGREAEGGAGDEGREAVGSGAEGREGDDAGAGDDVRACGACDSCLLRKKGFAEAGLADPLPYQR